MLGMCRAILPDRFRHSDYLYTMCPGMCRAILWQIDIFRQCAPYVPGYPLTNLDIQTIGRQYARVCAWLSSDRFWYSHNVPKYVPGYHPDVDSVPGYVPGYPMTDLDIQTNGLRAKVLCRATETWVTSFCEIVSWSSSLDPYNTNRPPTSFGSSRWNIRVGRNQLPHKCSSLLYFISCTVDYRSTISSSCPGSKQTLLVAACTASYK